MFVTDFKCNVTSYYVPCLSQRDDPDTTTYPGLETERHVLQESAHKLSLNLKAAEREKKELKDR